MPTYFRIATQTLTTTAATVTFSNIPNTYTDLQLIMSVKTETPTSWDGMSFYFNNDQTSLYSTTRLQGNGTTITTNNFINRTLWELSIINTSLYASIFSVVDIYIPNYTVSQNRPTLASQFSEANATLAYLSHFSGLYRSTAAISSITLKPDANFVADCSFYLYGIKNS